MEAGGVVLRGADRGGAGQGEAGGQQEGGDQAVAGERGELRLTAPAPGHLGSTLYTTDPL